MMEWEKRLPDNYFCRIQVVKLDYLGCTEDKFKILAAYTWRAPIHRSTRAAGMLSENQSKTGLIISWAACRTATIPRGRGRTRQGL